MRIVPITLKAARGFVGAHHRHNKPPQGWLFGVGLEHDGKLCGVAIAGRPVARMLDDGKTVEITRTCTVGTKNANSKLYGAICRAAAAIGYERAITYTLESEPGTSLLASGFVTDATVAAADTWSRASRARNSVDLFGNQTRPTGAKVRWVRKLI